jgi:hypothetical protein
MANISDLLGTHLSATDLESRPVRIRYDLSTTVSPTGNNVIRMAFPTFADNSILDCRSIFLRFNLNMTPGTKLDVPCAGSIFRSLKVYSGSSCISHIEDLSTLLYLESRINTTATTSDYQRYLDGDQPDAAPVDSREHIIRFAPLGSILNSNACLPTSRLSTIFFELTLQDSAKCLWNPDTNPTYNISDIQCLCTYLKSASLSSYFNSQPLAFHVTDYSQRYSTITTQSALVRLQSAHTSLNSIMTVVRAQTQMNAPTDTRYKMGEFLNPYQSSNLYVNSSLWYDVDIDSNEQRFRNLVDVVPAIKNSQYVTAAAYNDGPMHILGIKVSAAPSEFSQQLLSGTSTKNLTSDLVLKLNLVSQPTDPLIATSYLLSSCLIYTDGAARGDLKIRF